MEQSGAFLLRRSTPMQADPRRPAPSPDGSVRRFPPQQDIDTALHAALSPVASRGFPSPQGVPAGLQQQFGDGLTASATWSDPTRGTVTALATNRGRDLGRLRRVAPVNVDDVYDVDVDDHRLLACRQLAGKPGHARIAAIRTDNPRWTMGQAVRGRVAAIHRSFGHAGCGISQQKGRRRQDHARHHLSGCWPGRDVGFSWWMPTLKLRSARGFSGRSRPGAAESGTIARYSTRPADRPWRPWFARLRSRACHSWRARR